MIQTLNFSYIGTAIEGSQVEVTLAKPVDKNDYVRYTRGVGSKPAFPQVGGLKTYCRVFRSILKKAYHQEEECGSKRTKLAY